MFWRCSIYHNNKIGHFRTCPNLVYHIQRKTHWIRINLIYSQHDLSHAFSIPNLITLVLAYFSLIEWRQSWAVPLELWIFLSFRNPDCWDIFTYRGGLFFQQLPFTLFCIENYIRIYVWNPQMKQDYQPSKLRW